LTKTTTTTTTTGQQHNINQRRNRTRFQECARNKLGPTSPDEEQKKKANPVCRFQANSQNIHPNQVIQVIQPNSKKDLYSHIQCTNPFQRRMKENQNNQNDNTHSTTTSARAAPPL